MQRVQEEPGTLEYLGITPQRQALTLLDLFAGAGGLSLGLHWAGFGSVAAVENDAAAAATYDANFGPRILRGGAGQPRAVEQVAFGPFAGQVDLLSGGPPCQGFSQLGTRLADDPRNRLWREFIRAVDEVQPRAFLMENVPPILKTREGAFTVEHARELGYSVVAGVLSAEQFGVPQKRRRAFFLGVRGGTASLPSATTSARPNTVRWAFEGLAPRPTGEDLHLGRTPTPVSLERYAAVPEGGNRFDLMRARPDITPRCWRDKPSGATDVFGRLSWDKPALTIRTEFYKPEKGRYLHPSEPRPITHREAARLQTFPDSFRFEGPRTEIARQIGNAVPPLLAYAVGMHLRAILESQAETMQQPSLFEAALS